MPDDELELEVEPLPRRYVVELFVDVLLPEETVPLPRELLYELFLLLDEGLLLLLPLLPPRLL
ncbi:MAG: hypothetical protein L6V35_07425 [Alistipes putredinis]|nr:MAG: hypothetical protein L6V35_07425 [Alistipes putredinis]